MFLARAVPLRREVDGLRDWQVALARSRAWEAQHAPDHEPLCLLWEQPAQVRRLDRGRVLDQVRRCVAGTAPSAVAQATAESAATSISSGTLEKAGWTTLKGRLASPIGGAVGGHFEMHPGLDE